MRYLQTNTQVPLFDCVLGAGNLCYLLLYRKKNSRISYSQIHEFLLQNSYSRRENESIGDGELGRTSKKTAAVERETAVNGNSRRGGRCGDLPDSLAGRVHCCCHTPTLTTFNFSTDSRFILPTEITRNVQKNDGR